MGSLTVEQDLFLNRGAGFVGEVVISGAKVGGLLRADGSAFGGRLNMYGLRVEHILLLGDGAHFGGAVLLDSAKVGELHLGSATFLQELVIANTVIDGELRLGASWADRPRWGPDATLVLRNTSVGALQDGFDRLPDGTLLDAWPSYPNLRLSGFAYKRLGSFAADSGSEMLDRPVSWYEGWLRRDPGFSPQPYRQLADVFHEAGADRQANEILYALRDREREVAWERGEHLRWFKLVALKWVIGYGIGWGYFLALGWAGVFTLFGARVLWSGGEEAQILKGFSWCIEASLDEILPIVQLDKAHEEFINRELGGWRLGYFYLHRIVAYVLGSFVVAGLAGLTQGV